MRSDLAALDREFAIVTEEVTIGAHVVRIEKPRNFDDLVSEEEFARDERLPYWADLWPSARVLARRLVEAPPPRTAVGGASAHDGAGAATGDGPAAPTALELGCGLGIVTIAAMLAGYAVTATDYYDDALRFAARNAWQALGREPVTRYVDWRALPDDLGRHDLVLAADVLYERIYAPLVAEAVHRALAPDGRVWLADQGRVALGAFLEEAAARGLRHEVIHRQPPAPGERGPEITVFELRRT